MTQTEKLQKQLEQIKEFDEKFNNPALFIEKLNAEIDSIGVMTDGYGKTVCAHVHAKTKKYKAILLRCVRDLSALISE